MCAICLQEDPTEHVNLLEGGGTTQHQLIAAAIKARIDEELDVVDGRSKGFFQANDIGTILIYTRIMDFCDVEFWEFSLPRAALGVSILQKYEAMCC